MSLIGSEFLFRVHMFGKVPLLRYYVHNQLTRGAHVLLVEHQLMSSI